MSFCKERENDEKSDFSSFKWRIDHRLFDKWSSNQPRIELTTIVESILSKNMDELKERNLF